MTPLWTTASSPSPPRCGWALASVGGTVRGPAGVADADPAPQRPPGEALFQPVDPSGRLAQDKLALRR